MSIPDSLEQRIYLIPKNKEYTLFLRTMSVPDSYVGSRVVVLFHVSICM